MTCVFLALFVATAWAARRYREKWIEAERQAARWRRAYAKAEAALEEIAEAGEIELPTQTILTGDALAARLGVDIKSQPR